MAGLNPVPVPILWRQYVVNTDYSDAAFAALPEYEQDRISQEIFDLVTKLLSLNFTVEDAREWAENESENVREMIDFNFVTMRAIDDLFNAETF